MPSERANLKSSTPVSLEAADEASMPELSQRFTSWPFSLRAMKFLSRSSFSRRAMRLVASSQLMRTHSFDPGARYSGYSSRFFEWTMSSSPAPLGQSEPRLTG
ncbi:hypothetical protein D3C81_1129240 [compost metagenome]